MKLEKLTVLVIEDTSPMRELLRSVLEAIGVGNVYTASDGEQGLNILQNQSIDIVLVDWEMPNLSGVDFVRNVRRNSMISDRHLPIIMCSGYAARERILEARDAGITEYMIKPFRAEDIAKRLEAVIKRPRDFIESGDFAGPDRRRKKDAGYKGPLRRKEDKEDPF